MKELHHAMESFLLKQEQYQEKFGRVLSKL
ncbi:hypothetical protein SAMN05421578_104273 [Paenibacillus macquariensis]|uniref:Transposase n=1 Tax=Paenibacillus macquariensis TaxID=948756 RepID=A0ABY1JV82_9BACL|nr:hypothetical protein SAMN05421578_104273 [Paenibacillus macquariensis]